METNALKKSLFGYNKKAVHALLEEVADKYDSDRSNLSEENGKLRDLISELSKQVEELKSSLDSVTQEKDYVASAIVSAEKEAAKILTEATIESDSMKENTARELAGEKAKIIDLRVSILHAMQSYKDKLDGIISRLSIDKEEVE
ncbi:MAG: DivIVA domain-containing protein [Bacillota bacterium]|nr:DivIVA domain-containing protein [Bacillota bacterium]